MSVAFVLCCCCGMLISAAIMPGASTWVEPGKGVSPDSLRPLVVFPSFHRQCRASTCLFPCRILLANQARYPMMLLRAPAPERHPPPPSPADCHTSAAQVKPRTGPQWIHPNTTTKEPLTSQRQVAPFLPHRGVPTTLVFRAPSQARPSGVLARGAPA